MDKTGVIYILTNPSFPEYVKIGYADDIDKRLLQLNRSECIPFAFRVYATYEVNSRLSDLKIHSIIDKLNPNLRSIENFNGKQRTREFYAISPEDAYSILEAIAEIHGCADKLKRIAMDETQKHAEETAQEIDAEHKPHLYIPVVTDPKKAAGALQWAVTEMLKRYRLFSELGVRSLSAYNDHLVENGQPKMPNVVVVIDELADLMLVASKEVEESICRVAQMGRAAGMHLVIATQRPSADVITGLMKANIPSRIAFSVASAMESRIILDTMGAEKLVGKGDMLYAPLGAGKPTRVQGCFITPEEIERVVGFVKTTGEAEYSREVMDKIEQAVKEKEKGGGGKTSAEPAEAQEDGDELLPAAVEVVLETGQASVSMLQRRLKLGYARAARIVDEMEEKGIVGPFQGSKPRAILITKEQWAAKKGGQTEQMGFDDLDSAPDELM